MPDTEQELIEGLRKFIRDVSRLHPHDSAMKILDQPRPWIRVFYPKINRYKEAEDRLNKLEQILHDYWEREVGRIEMLHRAKIVRYRGSEKFPETPDTGS